MRFCYPNVLQGRGGISMSGDEHARGASPTRRPATERRGSVVPNSTPPEPSPKTPRLRKSGSKLALYAPKLPAVSSAAVLVLVALLAPVVDRAYHRLATEGKIVSDVSSFSHDVGRFQVKWNQGNAQLSGEKAVRQVTRDAANPG